MTKEEHTNANARVNKSNIHIQGQLGSEEPKLGSNAMTMVQLVTLEFVTGAWLAQGFVSWHGRRTVDFERSCTSVGWRPGHILRPPFLSILMSCAHKPEL